eukprot:Colp12_sorted_trinity150504_noHs@31181
MAPKLDILSSLLEPSSVYHPNTDTNTSDAPTLTDLSQKVQASRAELIARLRQLGAFELGGQVRTAEKAAFTDHRKALLETAITQGYVTSSGVCQVDEGACLAAMRASSFEADSVLLQCVLRSLSEETQSGKAGGPLQLQLPQHSEPGHWTLDARKLKVAAAQMLFEEERSKTGTAGRGKSQVAVSLADFLLEWRLRTPGMRLQEEVPPEDLLLLRGVAVLVEGREGKTLHYLPVGDLQALDAKVRLAEILHQF